MLRPADDRAAAAALALFRLAEEGAWLAMARTGAPHHQLSVLFLSGLWVGSFFQPIDPAIARSATAMPDYPLLCCAASSALCTGLAEAVCRFLYEGCGDLSNPDRLTQPRSLPQLSTSS